MGMGNGSVLKHKHRQRLNWMESGFAIINVLWADFFLSDVQSCCKADHLFLFILTYSYTISILDSKPCGPPVKNCQGWAQPFLL